LKLLDRSTPIMIPDEVRRQLDKLLASRWFARSERMCRFLRFAVDRTLAGTVDDLKEYLVGVEVFDRGADYDPRVDPIVRVEARRLRAKLEAYYASAGKEDAVRIEFPKGAYAATFLDRTKALHVQPAEKSAARIILLPFTSLSPESADHFSEGLTEELILLLTRVQGLRLLAWNTDSPCPEERSAGTILRGSWRHMGFRIIRVTAQLIDVQSGTYLWSDAFERDVEDPVAMQEEIARAIVEAVRLKLVPDCARNAGRLPWLLGKLHQAAAIVDHEIEVSEQRITDRPGDRRSVVRADTLRVERRVVER
jgi:serine/threonine-protein kinase